MARPFKELEEKRMERFNLRFTLAELESIRAQAALAGLLPHEYARRRVLAHTVHPAPRRADGDVLYELNRIGVNVNQLAKAHNAGREFRGDWQAIAEELHRVLDRVAALYGS